MRIPAPLWLSAFAFILTGCSLFEPEKADASKEKPAEGPELVGRIASVPADKRFVLIQSYGNWKIGMGAILTTRGLDERTANLLVTGETLGQFAAADIQSGKVVIGDAVYSHHVPKPTEILADASGLEPELPETKQETQIGNVQKNN